MSPALGPNQAPIQYLWRAIYRELKWSERETNLHLHLVPRVRMTEALPPLHGVNRDRFS